MNVIALSPFDIGLAAGLVVSLAGVVWAQRLALAKPLLIAALRAMLQLGLIGLVLQILFSSLHPGLIALVAAFMLAVAGYEVMSRQQRRLAGWWGYAVGAVAMFVSSFSVAILALVVMVQPEPWYAPQYAIPLLGMLLGNTMTGIALGLDRLTQGLWRERAQIEARLALGEAWYEASAGVRHEAVRSALTPIINTMAAAGVVSLPGMMTGQILGGSPPMEAVKYQILILFLIAAGTGFGALGAVHMAARRVFDERQRLRLERLKAKL
ncbi:MAG: iron export ABC transporter permease subunit FetB [Gammaproteobacteria bacterium]|nr:iron export ABC transporter permease subunit FetB [Gammaproteobacteria bacterium]MCP5136261.1 iron export ABC transporter permease subunit FetB [Gammaproteobacteria bacterium]